MTYVDEVMADAPIIYARLEDTSGYPVNSGTATEISFSQYSDGGLTYGQEGISGNAVLRTKGFQTLSSPTSAAVTEILSGPAVTIEMWYNPLSTTVTQGLWGFSGRVPMALTSSANGIDNELRVNNVATYIGVGLEPNVWSHLVFVLRDDNTYIIYKNGELVWSGTTTMPTPSSSPLLFGSYSPSLTFSPALFDEIATYKYELSPQRILAHYNKGMGIEPIPDPLELDTYALPTAAFSGVGLTASLEDVPATPLTLKTNALGIAGFTGIGLSATLADIPASPLSLVTDSLGTVAFTGTGLGITLDEVAVEPATPLSIKTNSLAQALFAGTGLQASLEEVEVVINEAWTLEALMPRSLFVTQHNTNTSQAVLAKSTFRTELTLTVKAN